MFIFPAICLLKLFDNSIGATNHQKMELKVCIDHGKNSIKQRA